MSARLPSFTHFMVGLYPSGTAVFDWGQAVALAREGGHTCILGVTWDATQILTLDGRAAGEPVALDLAGGTP